MLEPGPSRGLQGSDPLNGLTEKIIRCAIQVHRAVGPGLFEKAYKELMQIEFQEAGIRYEVEKRMPILYRGRTLDLGYQADLVVEEQVIIELKAVSQLLPVHEAQLIGYLRLANLEVGLLMNFNEPLLKNGIRRKFNTPRTPLP